MPVQRRGEEDYTLPVVEILYYLNLGCKRNGSNGPFESSRQPQSLSTCFPRCGSVALRLNFCAASI